MLVTIITILFAAFCSASLSRFLSFCMEEGNILRPYYNWLRRVSKVQTRDVIMGENMFEEIISAKAFFWPLGGCVKCMNFWVTVPAWFFVADFFCMNLAMSFFAFWATQALSFYFLDKQLRYE